MRNLTVRTPGVTGQTAVPRGRCPQQLTVKLVDVLLQVQLSCDCSPIRQEQGRDVAPPMIAIRDCMEVGSIGIPLECPSNPTPLPPELFLESVDLEELFLEEVAQCPRLLIQSHGVGRPVNVLDLSKQNNFLLSSIFS